MLKHFGRHIRHNVVAYLALFFALGGTAIAAKPLITGADVQDGSLTGADVSDASTLKGVDIDESDLGKVPSAANADFAADADKIDGKDLSDVARFGAYRGGGIFCCPDNSGPPGGGFTVGTGGFTVEHVATGVYEVRFPSGTFSGCHVPVVSATAQSGGGASVNATIFYGAAPCGEDGSASFLVHRQHTATQESVDGGFSFIAM